MISGKYIAGYVKVWNNQIWFSRRDPSKKIECILEKLGGKIKCPDKDKTAYYVLSRFDIGKHYLL